MRWNARLAPTYFLFAYLGVGAIAALATTLQGDFGVRTGGSWTAIVLVVFPYSTGIFWGVIGAKLTNLLFGPPIWMILVVVYPMALGTGWAGYLLNRRFGAWAGWGFLAGIALLAPLTLLGGAYFMECLRPWGPSFCSALRMN